MTLRREWLACGAMLCLMALVSARAVAQAPAAQEGPGAQGGRGAGPGPAGPGGGPGRANFVPEPVPPPRNFATSKEHYEFLYRLHKGGTRHTYESIPKWEGLWSAAGNTQTALFVRPGPPPGGRGEGPPAAGAPGFAGGEVIPGVLTPAYEEAFRKRRSLGADYDRLTTCEPAGYPRWLLEPYVREFVNTPSQSWWLNDLGNDTRRVFIGQEHKNVDGTHSPEGDSVGFWVDDMLIVHTIQIYPNDYFRGQPPTSNQFESVEIWRMVPLANGERRINVNVTFYDKLSLQRPLTAVYTFRRNTELEEAGYRMRHWECESNENSFLEIDKDGKPKTQFRLPGEPGFDDVRGVDPRRNPDLPIDLPGQSRNPIFDEAVTKK
ncbi:MAG TPA: hypothetical protein VFO67_10625 [Gemmatimonadales bacterium]|nr:hypothetical protein [Gemmatimonadales bacterium]